MQQPRSMLCKLFKLALLFSILLQCAVNAMQCDDGKSKCPSDFPKQTMMDLFGPNVKTCCTEENSYIFNDFCDVGYIFFDHILIRTH